MAPQANHILGLAAKPFEKDQATQPRCDDVIRAARAANAKLMLQTAACEKTPQGNVKAPQTPTLKAPAGYPETPAEKSSGMTLTVVKEPGTKSPGMTLSVVKEPATRTPLSGRSRPRSAEFRDFTAEIHSLSTDLAEEDELCRDVPEVSVDQILNPQEYSKPKPLSAAREFLLQCGENARERSKRQKVAKKNMFANLGCCSEIVQVQKELEDAHEQYNRSFLELNHAKRAYAEEVEQLECEREYFMQEVAPQSNDNGETIEALNARQEMLRGHLELEEADRQAKIEAAKAEITSLKQQTQQFRGEIKESKETLETGKEAHRQSMKTLMKTGKTATVKKIYQEELEKEREKGAELEKELAAAEERRDALKVAADAEVEFRAKEIERLHAEMKAVQSGNDPATIYDLNPAEQAEEKKRQREELVLQLEIEIAMLKEPATRLLKLFGEELNVAVEAGSEAWITAFASALKRVKAALQERAAA